MSSDIQYFFAIARKAAVSKIDRRQFLIGSCATRNDSKIVTASNGPTFDQHPAAHAEARLCRKLDFGATVYVVRIAKGNGDYVMSRPCATCRISLAALRVKRVYYSIDPNQYGIWYPDKNNDSYHFMRSLKK